MSVLEALVHIFYGLNASELYRLKCCCRHFKHTIERQIYLQGKINLYKTTTLAHARRYTQENNRDFVFSDLLYNPVLYPCESTQSITSVIQEYNRTRQEDAIATVFKKVGLDAKVLAKKPSEVNHAVVTCIKSGASIDTLLECFEFYGIDPATWISDPEQSYTVLHYAARYNRLDVAQMCVEVWGCSVNATTVTNNNPLHYAIHGCKELRAYLIAAGCNTNQKNIFGHLPPTADGDAVQVPELFQQAFNKFILK